MMVGGCVAAQPAGPTVAVIRPPQVSQAVEGREDRRCREIALGTSLADPALTVIAVQGNAIGEARLARGIATGAIAGAVSGRLGVGLPVGLAVGLIASGLQAAETAQAQTLRMQQTYDATYVRCMFIGLSRLVVR